MASEFATRPSALILCNAAEGPAFDRFAGVAHRNVEKTLLFRQRPSIDRYRHEYSLFRDALVTNGMPVLDIRDILTEGRWSSLEENPNHVFTRDSAITLPTAPGVFLPARMREPLRRPETRVLEAVLERLGLFPLPSPPRGVYLEGGDVVPFEADDRRVLLVGFGPRTSEAALAHMDTLLVPEYVDEIIGLKLAPWRINLDGGFLPVCKGVALIEPTSFDQAIVLSRGRRREYPFTDLLKAFGCRLIEVSRDESTFAQACNAICLGDRQIVYYDLAERVAEALRREGLEPILVPGRELVKGRGGPRCMSRPIYCDPFPLRTHRAPRA